ncbi:S-adenosyl-L-methionine-dependent methyltransferase [Clavulina sp. PMI_390]|nr:S-adenosyl-L-methionine-dependent methyltransferase [Clavulina sp. PMI_390]
MPATKSLLEAAVNYSARLRSHHVTLPKTVHLPRARAEGMRLFGTIPDSKSMCNAKPLLRSVRTGTGKFLFKHQNFVPIHTDALITESGQYATLDRLPSLDLSSESGRSYHTDPKSRYALPNDEREGKRLDLQFQVVKIAQGGLYPASIDAQVRKATRILDIGCGTGIWAAEMAKLLPNAEIFGVDISPVRHQAWHPKNLSFLLGNVHRKLPFVDGHFDVVNIRLCPDISLNPQTYPEAIRVLRSGGIFNTVVGNDLWSLEKSLSPALEQWLNKLKEGFSARGSKFLGDFVPSLLRDTAAFRDLSTEERDVPVGPWMEDEDMKTLGKLQAENVVEISFTCRPIYSSVGQSREEFDQMVDNLREDCFSGLYRAFWRYQMIYGTKL